MKRRIVKLCVFVLALLAGGAIANVAVAWRLAYVKYPLAKTQRIRQSSSTANTCNMPLVHDWTVSHSGGGSSLRISSIWNDADVPVMMSFQITFEENAQYIPKWAKFLQPEPVPAKGMQNIRTANAFGWPKLSLWWGTATSMPHRRAPKATVHGPPKYALINGIRLPQGSLTSYGGPIEYDRAVPLGVIWPGFAMNTVFYAAVLWLLLGTRPIPGFIRRRIRALRGLCPSCAYPIGTNPVCTECGTPVTYDQRAL